MYREILATELKIDKTLGYVYFLDRNHPLGSIGIGRVYYHRHVASLMRGEWLDTDSIVHHKDGNKLNNTPSNLEVMSSAEHSSLHQAELGNTSSSITCAVCGIKFKVPTSALSLRVTCSTKCASQHSIKWNISKDDLEILIWNKSYSDISKEYPISDVGVKKRAKSLGCLLPPPYFFNKTEAYRQEQRQLNNIHDLSSQHSSKVLA